MFILGYNLQIYMMKTKLIYLIPILILLLGFNQDHKKNDICNNLTGCKAKTRITQYINQRVVTDTITNWQFYKDSELLFKSNLLDSNRFTAKIKTSDNFESLILYLFYDFSNEIIKRKIKLVVDNQVLTTFEDENSSHLSFRMPKNEIDKIIKENVGKEIYINYSDSINNNELIVGILKFIKE